MSSSPDKLTPPPPARAWLRLTTALGLLGVVLAAGWIVGFAGMMIQAAETVDRNFREGSGRPADYREGALFIEQDSYLWLGYAIDHQAAGTWRMPRWTQRDNPPAGRPVHWASPYLWLLRGAGAGVAAVGDLSPTRALEVGSQGIGPGLHLLVVLVGATLLGRRFGWLAGGGFALAMAFQLQSMWDYHALRPDHQALYLAAAVLSVVLLLAGGLGTCPTTGESPAAMHRRRSWFVAAAVVAALGVWVSAIASVTLNLLVIGAVGLITLRPRGPGTAADHDPQVWRWWGWSGALACLAAWLIEYAPALPLQRLEVNHPIYALQWLAGGELLRLWTRWRCLGTPWTGRRCAGLVLALIGLLAPVLLIALGPAHLHALRDPLMRAAHRSIFEFKSFAVMEAPRPWRVFLSTYGFLVPALLLAPLLALWRGVPAARRLALGGCWLVTVLLLALGLAQVRWMGLFAGNAAILFGLVLAGLASAQGRATIACRSLAILLLLAGLGHAGWMARAECRDVLPLSRSERVDADLLRKAHNQSLIDVAIMKMISLDLGRRRGDAPWRMLAAMDFSPYLQYFAGIPCVGSLYWENAAGLAATAAFLNDETGATALEIARARRLTHVLLIASPVMVESTHHLAMSDLPPRHSLVSRLIVDSPDLPLWIMPDVTLLSVARARRTYLNYRFEVPIVIHRLHLPPESD